MVIQVTDRAFAKDAVTCAPPMACGPATLPVAARNVDLLADLLHRLLEERERVLPSVILGCVLVRYMYSLALGGSSR